MTQIVLTNYSLEEAQLIIIKTCLEENKDKSLDDISKLLHISNRTLYRFMKNNGIKHKFLNLSTNKAIQYLESKGFKVELIKEDNK